jgi:serine/threonine protein kinase/WD40 repeat protein
MTRSSYNSVRLETRSSYNSLASTMGTAMTTLDQAKEIFLTALEIAAPGARQAFLDSACGGDAALQRQIEELLEHQAALGSFLQTPAAGPTVQDPPASARPGTVIGPYKLIEHIGEGGMGTVWMAQQTEPVKRVVALKVIKAGMDSKQIIARFEAERQALALMDHPNIARVLDGGTTKGEPGGVSPGRPYFVMDLVKGAPITEYCDEHRLTPRQRVELFLPVCQALQHAHQKGIIHRDLKPSNVLVALYDGKPVPKVIDFGVAKAAGQSLTDKTLVTGFGAIVGTLEYMSPEQAEVNQLDIDTRSDIYSLGVLLYELLTGSPPFSRTKLEKAGMLEMLRVIREQEPTMPSTKLSTAEGLPTLAANRGTEPAKLTRLVRGELDWIAMKALEKDRDRRYETANGLARDIQRYLNDEPVQACPPSAGYRLKKFMRKHQRVVLTAAGLVGLLIAGTAVSTWQAARATRAMAVADRERERAQGRLWESLRDQARATRMSRRPGQRMDSLRPIVEAMQLPLPREHTLDELRTEAVAALALPDVEVEREWEGGVTSAHRGWAFDGKMERYARLRVDGTVSVHQIADDTQVAQWKEITEGPWPALERSLQFSPDGRYLSVYHKGSRKLVVRRLMGQEPEVCYRDEEVSADFELSVDFTQDSTSLAYIKTDTRIAVVDLSTGRVRYSPPADAEQRAIRFAPDGLRVALGVKRGNKYAVEVRELASGRTESALPHPAHISDICWHSDGGTVATCCNDHLIRIWDVTTGNVILKLEGHRQPGIHCAFNCSGEWLISNDWQRQVRFWEMSSGRQALSTPLGGYHLLRVSPEGRVAGYKAGDVDKLQLMRFHSNTCYRTIVPGAEPDTRYPITIHPEGRLLAVAIGNHSALVDLASGREVASLPSDMQPLLWEPHGGLLTAGKSGLWRRPVHQKGVANYRLGPPKQLVANGPKDPWGASTDGQVIAIPQYRSGAVVLHLGPPRQTIHLKPHVDVRACAVSPDGRWVATAAFGNSDEIGIKVWEAVTGRLVKEIAPLGGTAAFSADGRWLLTNGGGCRLWEVGTWTEGHKVGGANGCVSADGRFVAVEDSAGAIRLVSTDTGALVVRLESPEQTHLIPRAFTPDGTQLIAIGAETQALHVWDLRVLRRGLTQLGLDWDARPYTEPGDAKDAPPLRVTVVSQDAALTHVKLGEWDEAASVYALLVESNPNEHWYWYCSAPLHLQIGDKQGYLQICREMLARFGKPERLELAHRTAQTCLLAPEAVPDLQPVLNLADCVVTGMENKPFNRWVPLTKALAEYRAAHYAAAVEWLNRFSPRVDGVHYDATAFAVLAMAKHRLGLAPGADAARLAEEAQAALTHAQAILSQKTPDPKAGRPWGTAWPYSVDNFHDWLHAQILVHEAEKLLGKNK